MPGQETCSMAWSMFLVPGLHGLNVVSRFQQVALLTTILSPTAGLGRPEES